MTVYPYLPRQGGDHFAPDRPGSAYRCGLMSDTPQVLLAPHLKALKLPTFLREYDKLARQCATDAVDHVRYLLRRENVIAVGNRGTGKSHVAPGLGLA
jgi:hypothetical protein